MAAKENRLAVILGLLLVCSLMMAGSAQAGIVYSEGFDSNGSGAERDASGGASGAGLKVFPASGSFVVVGRRPDLAVTGITQVSFKFRGSSTNGDTDTNVTVRLTNDDVLTYHLTESWNPNNRVSFRSEGYGQHLSFGQWTQANTWYQGVIVIDTTACKAWGELRDSTGLILHSASNQLGITCSAASISELEIDGISWSSLTTTFWYDDLTVTTVP